MHRNAVQRFRVLLIPARLRKTHATRQYAHIVPGVTSGFGHLPASNLVPAAHVRRIQIRNDKELHAAARAAD
jgi:hypothetical protein